MSNTKISELQETTDLAASYWIPLTQISGNTNTSKKMSSANFKVACKWDPWTPWAAGTQFDCTVAGTGWDYTTIWAALAAGKSNIFVKNGTYTETYWDCTAKNAIITGQSMLWVVVTFSQDVANTSNCYINADNGTGFNIKNITFNITYSGWNYVFIYTSTSFADKKFKIEWCAINYGQWNNPSSGEYRKLVSGTYIDMTYNSTLMTIPRSFENGFFDCYFYTNYDKIWWNNPLVLWYSWFNYFKECRFTTDTSAWTINLNGITILDSCFLDIYRYSWGWLAVIDTTINLKAGWSHSNNAWWPWSSIDFYSMRDSYIKYNTSVTTSTDMNIYYGCINTNLNILVNINFGNTWVVYPVTGNIITTTGNIICDKSMSSNNYFTCANFTLSNTQDTKCTGNKILCSSGTASMWYGAYQCISWNDIYASNTVLWQNTISWWDNSTFSGNNVRWTFEIHRRFGTISWNCFNTSLLFGSTGYENVFSGNRCSTIAIRASGNYNVITGNQNWAITDWATGTIKIGNRNN